MKSYRKRFVLYTMLLIGIVLLVAFASLDIYMYRNDMNELQNTMRLMLRPFDEPTDNFRKINGEEPPPEKHGGEGARGPKQQAEEDRNIITVFYDNNDGTLSFLSETPVDRERIRSAVEEIVQSSASYGQLKKYRLIYHKESAGDNEKIALADTSYILRKAMQNTLGLALAFLVSMGVFFLISLWLSRLAARPMEKAVEMERQFVADISHDLKTPITVILANNRILRDNRDTPVAQQEQWIESTETAAKNMMNMVGEMLTLSALESAERTVQKETVDLSSVAERAVLQMDSVAYDRGIALESSIEEGVAVTANQEYAARICNGLLENALKYEPDGGRVLVALKKSKKKAILTVKNEGSVIAPEDLPHIFERFYRGDKARSEKKGHGLGLPIMKQIAALINAQIRAESSAETGTVFSVIFSLSA